VNTHLEIRSEAGSVFRYFQNLQMQELLFRMGILTSLDPRPVIMVGDFNSSQEDQPGEY
jgi:endonuclease/exonuclease/phosphatase (EEP) superfamily protein YafD